MVDKTGFIMMKEARRCEEKVVVPANPPPSPSLPAITTPQSPPQAINYDPKKDKH